MPTQLRRLVLCVPFVIGATFASGKQPDVIMIAVDDLRPMLGCYGDLRIQTPNIDSLARRGVLFERAYCQYAKCGTSRLSLMTGLRPDSIGVFSNRDQDVRAFRERRPDVSTLSQWLGKQGYLTRSFGKIDHDGWHVDTHWSIPPSPGRAREMWEVVNPSDPDGPTVIAERLNCPAIQRPDVADNHLFAGRMTEEVLQTMRRRSGDQPLFLAVGYRRPHLPFVAPKRFFDLYQPDESWLARHRDPAQGAPVMAWFNADGYVGSARKVGLAMPNPPNRDQAVLWNGYELRSYLGVPNHGVISDELQLRILQAYAACVSYVDAQIGKLLTELEATGRLDETVIILWSDHGWHLGEQSAWSKMTNFEIATRVPLLIAAPEIKPARTRAIAELVDLYPTLCDLTHSTAPPHLEGRSLVEVMNNPAKSFERVAQSQHTRYSGKYMGRALRTDQFRFVQWRESKSGKVVERELYDHQTDPMETVNVANEPTYAKHVMRLDQRTNRLFRQDE